MKTHLIISIPIRAEDENNIILAAKTFLRAVARLVNWPGVTKFALTRDGDRSGGNLLLEQLDGRFGTHYQGRKAKLSEIIND